VLLKEKTYAPAKKDIMVQTSRILPTVSPFLLGKISHQSSQCWRYSWRKREMGEQGMLHMKWLKGAKLEDLRMRNMEEQLIKLLRNMRKFLHRR
jgi:hypothetical protein